LTGAALDALPMLDDRGDDAPDRQRMRATGTDDVSARADQDATGSIEADVQQARSVERSRTPRRSCRKQADADHRRKDRNARESEHGCSMKH
jgi:hypothetical protein